MEPIKITETEQGDNGIVCRGELIFVHQSDEQKPEQWLLQECFRNNRIVIPVAGGEYRRLLRSGFNPIKPLIVSTEDLSEGDWVINKFTSSIYRWNKEMTDVLGGCYKIIVFHEQFSRATLLSFVEGKFKNGDNVFVKCTDRPICSKGKDCVNHDNDNLHAECDGKLIDYMRPSIDENGCVTIFPATKHDIDYENVARFLYGYLKDVFGKEFEQWVSEDYYVNFVMDRRTKEYDEDYIKGLREKFKKRIGEIRDPDTYIQNLRKGET